MDVDALRSATGWTVHHLPSAGSTNDHGLRLMAEGARARTVVVADEQTSGRGRGGRYFRSPPGGLYVSLLLAARPEDVPAHVVALAGVATAEAVEGVADVPVRLKWPNDLWLGEDKLGGVLVECKDPDQLVVVGIGLNLRAVPVDLQPDERAVTAALEPVCGRRISRQALLAALLHSVDGWLEDRAADGWDARLESAWRGRLALIGRDITCRFAGRPLHGVLEDASLRGGLLIRDADSGPVWRQAEHVQDLRPAGRTIAGDPSATPGS